MILQRLSLITSIGVISFLLILTLFHKSIDDKSLELKNTQFDLQFASLSSKIESLERSIKGSSGGDGGGVSVHHQSALEEIKRKIEEMGKSVEGGSSVQQRVADFKHSLREEDVETLEQYSRLSTDLTTYTSSHREYGWFLMDATARLFMLEEKARALMPPPTHLTTEKEGENPQQPKDNDKNIKDWMIEGDGKRRKKFAYVTLIGGVDEMNGHLGFLEI